MASQRYLMSLSSTFNHVRRGIAYAISDLFNLHRHSLRPDMSLYDLSCYQQDHKERDKYAFGSD